MLIAPVQLFAKVRKTILNPLERIELEPEVRVEIDVTKYIVRLFP